MDSQEWTQFLTETKVRKLMNPHQKLVTVDFADDVRTLLKKLADGHVLSALVTTAEKPGVIGFVDVLDIMSFVIQVTQESQKDVTAEKLETLIWEGKIFSRETTGHLIDKSACDPYITVTPDNSLLDIAKLFADGTKRVAVVENSQPVNVISQLDLVKFLTKRGILIEREMSKPLKEVGLEPLGVNAVREDLDVVSVLKFMRDNKLSAVPILDQHGTMVAHFSATDLLGLNEENFPMLSLGIREFLRRVYGHKKPAVFCFESDTVELAILRLLANEVHRIYIVDKLLKPVGVISLTDVIQFFLSR